MVRDIAARCAAVLRAIASLEADIALRFPQVEEGAAAVTRALRARLGGPADLTVRELRHTSGRGVALLYLAPLVDEGLVQQSCLAPLAQVLGQEAVPTVARLHVAILPNGHVAELWSTDALVQALLAGSAILAVDGEPAALAIDVASPPHRAVGEPKTESVVRGPRDGFTEDLRVNLGLVRLRLRSDTLRVERFDLGYVSHTDVLMLHLEGIAAPDLVTEARQRLSQIDLDAVLETGYIEELIDDNPLSVFPSAWSTERPDRVTAGLLSGYVAILVEGTPFVLMVPGQMANVMQSPEDYYVRYPQAVVMRAVRWLALLITSTLPATYVAITTFHQELLPPPLFLSFAAARQGVPIPVWLEAVLMESAFELLREAGVRMPRTVGQTVSVVGVLVIGQAAVAAKIVSPIMIVIVGTTAISSFAIPNLEFADAVRMLRFPAILAAAVFGLYGLVLGVLLVAVGLLDRTSFGQPFVSRGFFSTDAQRWKDVWWRAPWWLMHRRPAWAAAGTHRRQPSGQSPPA